MSDKKPAGAQSVPVGLSAELTKDKIIGELQAANKALQSENRQLKEKADSWDEQRAVLARIDKELPEGWEISYGMAPDGWRITLADDELNAIGFNSDDAETDAQMIECALNHAIRVAAKS
ncbi:flagellar motor protein MotB [Undibacterium sp. GrIS 1.8]|uniref:hypothetical protein n=1 Tax=Undibacterium sp. GrIS 1.8 TaxID=3143934 RepID=UPI0033972774